MYTKRSVCERYRKEKEGISATNRIRTDLEPLNEHITTATRAQEPTTTASALRLMIDEHGCITPKFGYEVVG